MRAVSADVQYMLAVFAYPALLALLCIGAGLAVERAGGRDLPLSLLPAVGVAALIALSQLLTYAAPISRVTPWAMLALAAAGLVLCRRRAAAMAAAVRARPGGAAMPVLAYALAIAPVLLAGRPSFSAFMALSDSAVHMIGADYLIEHGRRFTNLDAATSYGQFIHNYYGTSYPSGADTLFGGSALLVGVPLIWAFQPLNAFLLACALGPARILARAGGLRGAWASAAALAAVAGALVYAYELIGSVKEMASLPMLLGSGALLVEHRRWLAGGPRAVLAPALLLAAGVSALGVAFGVWAVVAALVVAALLLEGVRSGELRAGRAAATAAAGVAVALVAALPTVAEVQGSVQAASAIASTSNPGNLHSPLRAVQSLGVWLGGSYKERPGGAGGTLTSVLVALALACCALGVLRLVQLRVWVLSAWLGLLGAAWLAVSLSVTTWASAKTLMLTSPAVVILAWTGVGWLLGERRGPPLRAAGAAIGVALLLGVLASDALQYRATNLAPTARYRELEAVGRRFGGEGPAVFTDFDEYAMYVLRDIGIAGPDFTYGPPWLAAAASGYGTPVELGRLAPAALARYPLLITRRDPTQPRPPAAYAQVWGGDWYLVWRRRPGARPALAHVTLPAASAAQCSAIGALAARAPAAGSTLAGAVRPALVRAPLLSARRPAGWGRQRQALVMGRVGTLQTAVVLPHTGAWELWLQGEFMPGVSVAVDGRVVARPAGELSGNSLVADTLPPVALLLSAGRHEITVTRGAPGWAPGAKGAAVLFGVTFAPAGSTPPRLLTLPASSWSSLCGRDLEWVELLGPSG